MELLDKLNSMPVNDALKFFIDEMNINPRITLKEVIHSNGDFSVFQKHRGYYFEIYDRCGDSALGADALWKIYMELGYPKKEFTENSHVDSPIGEVIGDCMRTGDEDFIAYIQFTIPHGLHDHYDKLYEQIDNY